MEKILAYYLLIIQIIAVIITVYDKIAAKNNSRRISEKNLLTVALLGGGAGMYITMQFIRHKTKHTKFMLGLPIIIIFNVICVYLALK